MSIKLSDENNNEEKVLSDINVTPLIDIMLVLLILFMVTSSITVESGLDIDLPKTTSQTQKKESTAVLVSLDSLGNVMVQGKKVESGDYKTAISDALKDSHSELVVFEGDKEANLGKVIEIMDIAKDAGAQKFAIAAEQKK